MLGESHGKTADISIKVYRPPNLTNLCGPCKAYSMSLSHNPQGTEIQLFGGQVCHCITKAPVKHESCNILVHELDNDPDIDEDVKVNLETIGAFTIRMELMNQNFACNLLLYHTNMQKKLLSFILILISYHKILISLHHQNL